MRVTSDDDWTATVTGHPLRSTPRFDFPAKVYASPNGWAPAANCPLRPQMPRIRPAFAPHRHRADALFGSRLEDYGDR
ncbi:hypothetical protein ACWDTR_09520 [Streptomyces sp. NPDC003470]